MKRVSALVLTLVIPASFALAAPASAGGYGVYNERCASTTFTGGALNGVKVPGHVAVGVHEDSAETQRTGTSCFKA